VVVQPEITEIKTVRINVKLCLVIIFFKHVISNINTYR
jgi:hypothetical protein